MGRKLTALWDERELGNSVNAFYLLLLLLLLSFPMCPTDLMPNWASCVYIYSLFQLNVKARVFKDVRVVLLKPKL